MSRYKPIRMSNSKKLFAISALLSSSQVYAIPPNCDAGDMGGQVFMDLPVNGVSVANTYGAKEANESGLEGISVTVVDANGASQSVTTDANGDWTVEAPVFPVRVQFSWSESWLKNSSGGSDSNTSLQFVAASACDANLGLHDPSVYSQTNPDIALACYVNGTGVGSSEPGLVSTAYTSTGLNSQYTEYPADPPPDPLVQGTGPVPSSDATVDEVGASWGVAWQAGQSRLFLSTFLKRHSGMADGPGYVYVMDYSGASASLAHKFDLTGITPANGGSAIDLGAICRDAACASNGGNTGDATDYELSVGKTTRNRDLDAFAKVGTMSFGDIDMQPGSNTLWLVNIFQNALISVDVSGDAILLPGVVNQYPFSSISGMPTCSGGVMRPWALSFSRGKGYLGAVCDGSISNNNDDIKAYVLSFDPNNVTAGVSTELDFALNYARDNDPFISFHAWLETYDATKILNPDARAVYPQPILSDIEFDPDGNMYLNIMDRLGHQIGHDNYKPVAASVDQITVLSTGDMLKACKASGGFVLEGNAGCDASEFFEDRSGDSRAESASGAFLSLMGSNEIMSLVVDPHPSGTVGIPYWHTQGVNTYNLDSGLISNWYAVNYSASIGLSGKGTGLGDIELLTDAAPIEVGNRVWNDTNNNGLQDANETGIDGVDVVLTCGADTTTVATANGGQYLFSNADNDSAFMASGDSCTISIDMTQGALTGLGLTAVDADNDQTNSALTDLLDSDAIFNQGQAEITVTVGQAGDNNHSLDFGFQSACVINAPVIVSSCTNNGTPSDSADDVFSYIINASGANTAISYNISDNDTRTGVLYDQDSASFGDFPISSGNLSLTLTDTDDSSCLLSDVVVTAPATCSDVAITYDFGDAPDSYGTTLAAGGAQHQINANLSMGASLDDEADGQPNALAGGDGADEDGASFPSSLADGGSFTINVAANNNTGSTANLVCWIDYNGDGVFATDGSESGVASVVDGSNNAQVAVAMPNVPVNASTATNGTAYIRCRLTTAALTAANPTGLVADGEVEDYRVTIEAVPVCSIDTPVTSATCDDNGTPSDATDDLFGYTINASGSNTGASYSISGGDSQAGLLYGQVSGAFSGFPISAGGLTLTLTDVADNSCTLANVSIAAPATCSNSAPPANFDFGDAPDSYGTSETGHRVVSGLQLGAALDNEPAGQDGGTATGDGPDEDGVIIPALIDGAGVTLSTTATNTTGTNANLVCWIDYNGDGLFATDGSESGSAIVANGSTNTSISVGMPAVPGNSSSLTNGSTFVRCRLTTDPLTQNDPTGFVNDGEVEDYRVPVRAPAGVTPPSTATPIPTLSEWMMVLLSALMVLLGWQTRRQSRID